jgi:FAD/FMN-containing dehydrogenase
MKELRIKTRTGATKSVSARSVAGFADAFRGQLVLPDSPDYDSARKIWNATVDRRPAVIVRCTTALDVVQTVRFADEHDLLLAVRGGGHNVAGNSVCDDGLVLDLSHMRAVRVDPGRRTVTVEGGVTLGELDAQTQRFGLATPLGINSTTGVAGLTLGGGFGWLSRKLGLTIDNLQSADVVTADGKQVKASPSDDAELFWAIRGGSGNFGVVTSFELGLHPIGPEVYAGLVIHPINAANEVLRAYRDIAARAPDELACWFVLRQAPPLPFLAPEWHGKEIVVLALCWSGPRAAAEEICRAPRGLGRPIADVVGPAPYTAWQQVLDPLLQPGQRNYWKTHNFKEVSDGLIDTLAEQARRLPDPQTEIAVAHLGGAINRVAPDATAYPHRDVEFVMNVHGRWGDPAKDEACIGWARELHRATASYATGGAYVNFLTQDDQERVYAAYGANHARLERLKRRYDPDNRFRLNHNVQPAA